MALLIVDILLLTRELHMAPFLEQEGIRGKSVEGLEPVKGACNGEEHSRAGLSDGI
jgi:hypothetical protein